MINFSQHISAGIKFDGAVCKMMLGNCTEDPLDMGALKKFSNELLRPRVNGY